MKQRRRSTESKGRNEAIPTLKGSIIIYGIPAGSIDHRSSYRKRTYQRFRQKHDPDIVSAVSGFGLFALSFLAVKIWSRRFEKNRIQAGCCRDT